MAPLIAHGQHNHTDCGQSMLRKERGFLASPPAVGVWLLSFSSLNFKLIQLYLGFTSLLLHWVLGTDGKSQVTAIPDL